MNGDAENYNFFCFDHCRVKREIESNRKVIGDGHVYSFHKLTDDSVY